MAIWLQSKLCACGLGLQLRLYSVPVCDNTTYYDSTAEVAYVVIVVLCKLTVPLPAESDIGSLVMKQRGWPLLWQVLDEIMTSIHLGCTCLTLPRKRTLEEIVRNPALVRMSTCVGIFVT